MNAEEQLKELSNRLHGAGIAYTTRELNYGIYYSTSHAFIYLGSSKRGGDILSLKAPHSIIPDLTTSLHGALLVLEGYRGNPITDNAGIYIDFIGRSMQPKLENLSDDQQRKKIHKSVRKIAKTMDYSVLTE